MSAIRWGIIGLGDVVARKSGPAIMQRESCIIQHVMRRDESSARSFAEMYEIPNWSTNASTLLADPDVDIVYIATPPSTHAEYTCAAAAAGKHVLVEKPMAISMAQAEKMCAACESAGVELFVSYYRRFQPHVRHLQQLLFEGCLGSPLSIVVDIAAPTPSATQNNWRLNPDISGGGIFMDIACHRLDVLISLLGIPTDLSGFAEPLAGNGDIEGLVALALKFENGSVASVSGDFSSGRQADRLEIYGPKGSIAADPLDGSVFSFYDGNRTHLKTHRPYDAPHYGLIAHIEKVLHGEKQNRASGREALETERILDFVRSQIRG